MVDDPLFLASDLRLAVHRLARRLRVEQPDDDLTLTQISALATIWRFGPLTAGDLAQRERVRPPSISRVLASLEAAGLAQRRENPRDARQVIVSVTPAGDRRILEAVRMSEAWLAERLQMLTADEHDVLAKAAALMERLASAEERSLADRRATT